MYFFYFRTIIINLLAAPVVYLATVMSLDQKVRSVTQFPVSALVYRKSGVKPVIVVHTGMMKYVLTKKMACMVAKVWPLNR